MAGMASFPILIGHIEVLGDVCKADPFSAIFAFCHSPRSTANWRRLPGTASTSLESHFHRSMPEARGYRTAAPGPVPARKPWRRRNARISVLPRSFCPGVPPQHLVP